MYPKPDLHDFVNRSGKYLALIKPNYLTIFVANDKNKTVEDILSVINGLGECHNTVYNEDRIDFLINDEQWYCLTDYSNGVIES
jgi:hypothetical protein